MSELLNVEVEMANGVNLMLFGDAVLHGDTDTMMHGSYMTPRAVIPKQLYAMSIVGNEQAIRAVAAGCQNKETTARPRLRFVGPTGHTVVGKWMGDWTHNARMLDERHMHLVAVTPVNTTIAVQKSKSAAPVHVVIPSVVGRKPSKDDLTEALYERLLLAYTTPLIPPGQPGQPDEEAELGRQWRSAIIARLYNDGVITPLVSHPEQRDQSWAHCARIRLSQSALDDIVVEMVKAGALPFRTSIATRSNTRHETLTA